MSKRDIYNSKEKWENWKEENKKGIAGLSNYNAKLILDFLQDFELGKNTSKSSPKGARSFIRLLTLKGHLIFIAQHFHKKKLIELTKDDIHKLFESMKTGKIKKSNGDTYKSTGDYIKDFKTFWNWLLKIGKVKVNIAEDLSGKTDNKPAWVYLTEEQFKQFANRCDTDYKALMWLMYDAGCRVTEAYSLKVSDFQNDFKQLVIREETAKNKLGRTINLKLCSSLMKEYVSFHNLKPDDFIFIKKQPAFNKYLKIHSEKLFGLGVSHPRAKGTYNKFTLYDIRHNSSCYWLKRYPSTSKLMYRMGWSSEKFVKYYSEFLGLSDTISDDDMVLSEDKTKYEKEIANLKHQTETELEKVKQQTQLFQEKFEKFILTLNKQQH